MSTSLDLNSLAEKLVEIPGPLVVPWPRPGKAGAFVEFRALSEWHLFLEEFGLRQEVHLPTRLKYHRAHMLYLLAWLDVDLIKAGELVALTVLELALNDCYGFDVVPPRQRPKKPSLQSALPRRRFADLLRYMVDGDGLTDDQLPIVKKYGGSVIWLLDGTGHPSLAEIRNELAHGHPYDGVPRSGLLELCRDLIHYAYGVR
jgi:hypothetical protein